MPTLPPEDRPTRRHLLGLACSASFSIPTTLAGSQEKEEIGNTAVTKELVVHAGQLVLAFRTAKTGLALARIGNRATGVEHLPHASQVFGVACGAEGEWLKSDEDFIIDGVDLSAGGESLRISGRGVTEALSFTVSVSSEARANVGILKLSFRNTGKTKMSCRIRAPWIQGLATKNQGKAMRVALPQEAGGVVSTEKSPANTGMPVNVKLGLPHAMNTMEVFSLYDPNGKGGVFFSDAEADLDVGSAPIQFTFVGDAVTGSSLMDLNPGESRTLPAFAIGVHETGDWHYAVDDYCDRHRAHWNFPSTPAWFREQGALYSFSGSGGGAIYMEYPQQDLKSRIRSFEQLPSLLDEALSLGTNIIYLWDYWQGATKGGRPQYWNKGDYNPRSDLGGEKAFRQGIRQIHERGGRIILYVEPFIAFWYSHIGEDKGEQWGGRDANGTLYHHYPQNYTMAPCFRPWQEYVVHISTGLVRDFDVDGIFLDSWGWQLNWPMQTAEEKLLYTPLQYNLGVLDLAKSVRIAIRDVKPDAIVMGESTSGALGRYWDGGLSADFAWVGHQNGYQMLGSPVRYAMPEMNVFTNGRTLSELNQVFAAGYHLALLNANLPNADYIRKLVRIRQDYKDALIYGRQVYQPVTGDESVTAYCYRGARHEIVTVCNHGSRGYEGKLILDASARSSQWQDLLKPNTLRSSGTFLSVKIPAGDLSVMARRGAERTNE